MISIQYTRLKIEKSQISERYSVQIKAATKYMQQSQRILATLDAASFKRRAFDQRGG